MLMEWHERKGEAFALTKWKTQQSQQTFGVFLTLIIYFYKIRMKSKGHQKAEILVTCQIVSLEGLTHFPVQCFESINRLLLLLL